LLDFFQFLTLEFNQVKTDHELWYQALHRCNAREQRQREEIEKEQQPEAAEQKADLTDIDKLFTEKGTGPHMYELEFEPCTPQPIEYASTSTNSNKLTRRWDWKHKVTGVIIKRYTSQTGNSFDTGRLSNYLRERIKKQQYPVAFERGQHICLLNDRKRGVKGQKQQGHEVAMIVNREELVKQWVRLFACCFRFFPAFTDIYRSSVYR
jgi:hypothetical protein